MVITTAPIDTRQVVEWINETFQGEADDLVPGYALGEHSCPISMTITGLLRQRLGAKTVISTAFLPYLDGEGVCTVHFVDDYDMEVYVPPQVVTWALDFDNGRYPSYAANRSE